LAQWNIVFGTESKFAAFVTANAALNHARLIILHSALRSVFENVIEKVAASPSMPADVSIMQSLLFGLTAAGFEFDWVKHLSAISAHVATAGAVPEGVRAVLPSRDAIDILLSLRTKYVMHVLEDVVRAMPMLNSDYAVKMVSFFKLPDAAKTLTMLDIAAHKDQTVWCQAWAHTLSHLRASSSVDPSSLTAAISDTIIAFKLVITRNTCTPSSANAGDDPSAAASAEADADAAEDDPKVKLESMHHYTGDEDAVADIVLPDVPKYTFEEFDTRILIKFCTWLQGTNLRHDCSAIFLSDAGNISSHVMHSCALHLCVSFQHPE
jgi:hypothetical protein